MNMRKLDKTRLAILGEYLLICGVSCLSCFKQTREMTFYSRFQSKKVSRKSCRVPRGRCNRDLELDLGVEFPGYSKVKLIFLNGVGYSETCQDTCSGSGRMIYMKKLFYMCRTLVEDGRY